MTRKEQKENRQKQILFKALELFVIKGYMETKITDIASSLNISVGLLFHYYESKEQLYLELVKIGLDGMKAPQKIKYKEPIEYFEQFLENLFETIDKEPWICQMFLLMAQAQKQGIPENIRKLALSVHQIELSSKVIEEGQKNGTIKKGNAFALSNAFWCSVQGIMERKVNLPEIPLPEVSWILDILRKIS